jgi:hypothetical protein
LRLLLDQNMPHDLRDLLPGHTVKVSPEMGWERLSNGDLLTAAEHTGFDAMITGDKTIRYEQRLAGRRIALLVLSTNVWPVLRRHGDCIRKAVDGLVPGAYVELNLPRSALRRRPPPPRSGPG